MRHPGKEGGKCGSWASRTGTRETGGCGFPCVCLAAAIFVGHFAHSSLNVFKFSAVLAKKVREIRHKTAVLPSVHF